jgi:hypothetical protein
MEKMLEPLFQPEVKIFSKLSPISSERGEGGDEDNFEDVQR